MGSTGSLMQSRFRFGLAGRMTIGLAMLVVMTLAAAGTALWGIEKFREGFDLFALERQRQLTGIARLVQSTESLAAAAPRLITVRDNLNLQRERHFISDLLILNGRAFDQVRQRGADPATVAELQIHRTEMIENLDRLAGYVGERLSAADAQDGHLRNLGLAYEQLAEHQGDSATAVARGAVERVLPLVFGSIGQSFPGEVQRIQNLVVQTINAADMEVTAGGAPPEWPTVKEILAGDQGFFSARLRLLDIAPRIQGLMLENNALSRRLSSSATNLFVDLENRTDHERRQFERLMELGRAFLLVVVAVAVVGAGVVFVFVRRRVIARLLELQACMAERADGRATPIPKDGGDEISDMADSLEFFVNTIKEKEEELVHLASTDALTGLPNRRLFIDAATGEFERFRRYGDRTALMVFDFDHFKRINDTHGHAVGDEVLRRSAGLLRHLLRSVDIPGRIGGEEFAVLMPETDLDGGFHMAERIRDGLSQVRVPHGDGEISFTVSVGVSTFTSGDPGFETAMARADDALYRAKAEGRNRTVMNP